MADNKNLFKQFVNEMNEVLQSNTEDNGKGQSALFSELFSHEKKFRDVLLSTSYGKEIYKRFMFYISREKDSILQVMPYFRERQETFSKKISKSFENGNHAALHKFRINFIFASWVLKNWESTANNRTTYRKQYERLVKIFEEMKRIRRLLCENSLPLAINRSKIFWSKVPESHLEYMDLIQNSAEGLMVAIDKFTPPYKTVFRSTAIGRMTLNMMTDYNATLVKLPPREKRILYRHGIAKNRKNIENDNEALDFVKESFKNVTQENLQHIVNAATSVQSLDWKAEDGSCLSDKLACNGSPEEEAIGNEQSINVIKCMDSLFVIEKKVVILKTGY